MNRIKRTLTATLVAVFTIVGFGGLVNEASAVTTTNSAGQYGTVESNGGAEVYCQASQTAGLSVVDGYIRVYPTKFMNIAPGVVVDQTAWVKSWSEYWDGSKGQWVVASSYTTKDWNKDYVWASYYGQSSARIYTGRVTVIAGYFQRVGFDVYWQNNATGTFVAHKTYYASASEYRTNGNVQNTAYCKI